MSDHQTMMVAGGTAWIALMSSFNITAQTTVPAWVRARGLAAYWLVFQGGMAAGSALWRAVSERAGIPLALVGAASGLVVGLAAMRRYPLHPGGELDLTPSPHWPEPTVVVEPLAEQGPVLVTVEYRIDPTQATEFTRSMQAVRRRRLRDGARRWGLFTDTADPHRYVEMFLVEFWVEHLRQHERVTLADREADPRASAFHIGPMPPMVTHLIAVHGTNWVADTSATRP
jgi:Transmembrane secretion effector